MTEIFETERVVTLKKNTKEWGCNVKYYKTSKWTKKSICFVDRQRHEIFMKIVYHNSRIKNIQNKYKKNSQLRRNNGYRLEGVKIIKE